MCGIFGFNFEDRNLLKRGMNILQHRGPDDSGSFTDKNISLGHRRLSIIDLKTGRQPMIDKDNVIVYNGEIYNFKELKNELRANYKTNSDTEVILKYYQKYNADCLKYFNGMFAFCIYDKKKKILFLARDRIGIKPLYYYFKDGKFIFASEIKAILQDKGIKKKLNSETLVDYLTFQNILDEKTFFEDIFILQPGHYLVFDLKNKSLTKEQYYDFDFKINKKKRERGYITQFKKIFEESVKRHLVSDVKLGSYLSGGFDSTSVATIASRYIKKIETFTGKFNDPDYDETKCSRAVKKRINAVGNEMLIKPEDFIESFPLIIYHLDEPKVALPAFSQYYVSKLVSEKVKVVLTGHAGDELFAGYPVYKAIYYKELVRENPLNIFKAITAFKLSEIPRSLYFAFFPLFHEEVKHGLFIMFNKSQRKKLFTREFYGKIKNYRPSSTAKKIFPNDQMDNIDKIQYIYLKTYLPSLLIVEDKMGMAHSIEARTPICDNELVDFALSIPMEYKIYNNTLKYIIKEGMKDKLPEVLYKEAKRGFPTPLSKWFRRELKEYVYSVLLDEKTKKRGIFNMRYVKKILDRHCNSKTDNLLDLVNANKIWSLLCIEMWFRIFIDSSYPL